MEIEAVSLLHLGRQVGERGTLHEAPKGARIGERGRKQIALDARG